jgi:Fe-S-cluster containining protein
MANTWKGAGKKRAKKSRPQSRLRPPALAVKGDDGRVHLLLQHQNNAPIAVALSGRLFQESWQEALTLSTANTALRHCGVRPHLLGITAATQEAMAALSKLSEGLIAQADPTVACHAGCDHCCHQSVGVTALEAVTIVEHLRSNLDETALSALRQRVATARERTRSLSREQRYSPLHPCVFLGEGGRCTVYEVRPLVCRAMNSLDDGECRTNLHDAERRRAFLEHGRGPTSLLGPFRASHAMSAGLQLAGSDVYGLDTRPLDLVAAVDRLLDAPDVARRWLNGETVLESAVGSNATHDAQLRALAGLDPNVA